MRAGPVAKRGPEFVRFFAPLLYTLRDLGDSGRPKEVSEKIAARLNLPDEALNRTNKNGLSRFANQVAWARFYLAKAGYIDTSRRGVWTLTESGRSSHLDHENALRIYHDVRKKLTQDEAEATTLLPEPDEAGPPPDEQPPGEQTYREEMAKMLQSLSPDGFERLCQRILREVGFEEVIVTGRTGDGGIDGFGTLRINRLVSDRVLFQCKDTPNKSRLPTSGSFAAVWQPARTGEFSLQRALLAPKPNARLPAKARLQSKWSI
jgi:restriction system protein